MIAFGQPMIVHINEGDRIPIPCRHCASLSIEIPIAPGLCEARCGRCSRVQQIRVLRKDDGWSVTTEAADEVKPAV